jgi:hypothetical protein
MIEELSDALDVLKTPEIEGEPFTNRHAQWRCGCSTRQRAEVPDLPNAGGGAQVRSRFGGIIARGIVLGTPDAKLLSQHILFFVIPYTRRI